MEDDRPTDSVNWNEAFEDAKEQVENWPEEDQAAFMKAAEPSSLYDG